MTTVAYESFLPEVLPYVHDCAQLVAVNAIRNACIEFCEATRIWQYEVPAFDSVSITPTYTISVPTGTRIAHINLAWYQDYPLNPKGQDELQEIYRTNSWVSMVGQPKYITSLDPTQIRLVPYPDTGVTGAIKLTVALAPTRASTAVYDDVYNRFAEAIGHGARERLYGTMGQPYYDPAAAQAYRQRFLADIGAAKVQVNKGQTRGGVRVRFIKVA